MGHEATAHMSQFQFSPANTTSHAQHLFRRFRTYDTWTSSACQEHFVLMDTLAQSLRRRAEELGLSHAEVARRVGVSERRYGHYVAGRNEPDLATLLRIAGVLQTSPNVLLGFDTEPEKSKRRLLIDRLTAAASAMDERELEVTVIQAEAVAAR